MKKKTTKLVLSKETVKNLAESDIQEAAGGTNTVCWTELSCTQPRTFCGRQATDV